MAILLIRSYRRIIKFLIVLPAFFFLALLKLFFNFRLSTLQAERIGHLSGEIDIYLRKKQLFNPDRNFKRYIVIGSACNKTLLLLLKRYVPIIESKFLYRVLLICKTFKFMKIFFEELGLDSRAYYIYKRTKSPINLSDQEEIKGYKLIYQYYGIKEEDWWVCFHAREEGYLDSKYNYHNYRNSNILNMYSAMEYITSLGGYAIRYGSHGITKLDTTNPKIIDYTFSNHKSDFLDVFLAAKCKFFVGNTSGPRDLAKMFSVPYILTNLIGYSHITPSPTSLFIPKKVMYNKKILSFEECKNFSLFDPHKSFHYSTSLGFSMRKLTLLENSSEEILGSVKDLICKLNNEPIPMNIKNLQIKFKNDYFGYSSDIHDAGDLAPSFIKLNINLFH